MNLQEQITYINNCSQEDFINFAKEINIFRTLEEPNYLAIRQEIINLLPKFNLTENDVIPNPRITIGDLRAFKK